MASVSGESSWGASIISADNRMAARMENLKAYSRMSAGERFFGGYRGYEGAKGFVGPRRPRPGALFKAGGQVTEHGMSAMGFDFFQAAGGHYSSMRSSGPVYARTGRSVGIRPGGGIGPPTPVLSQAGMGTVGRRLMQRARSIGRVAGSAVVPGFALWGATQSEHGFAIGFAAEVAGFSVFAAGGTMGMATGATLGGVAMRTAGKIPFVGSLIGETALASGVGLAAGVGWLAGGIIAFEAARWSVGFVLNTLPTFAKQFQKDMGRSGFGGDYIDSAGAATMRQRSLQVMGKSFANARSALGQEASLLHV